MVIIRSLIGAPDVTWSTAVNTILLLSYIQIKKLVTIGNISQTNVLNCTFLQKAENENRFRYRFDQTNDILENNFSQSNSIFTKFTAIVFINLKRLPA